jgi:hypothetical protein
MLYACNYVEGDITSQTTKNYSNCSDSSSISLNSIRRPSMTKIDIGQDIFYKIIVYARANSRSIKQELAPKSKKSKAEGRLITIRCTKVNIYSKTLLTLFDWMEPIFKTSLRYFGLSNQMAPILGRPTLLKTRLIDSKLQCC